MVKEASLGNLVKDLNYIVFTTYVHDYLFSVFPPKPGVRILEPGCGSAKFSLSYALAGCEVRAFDINILAVDYARRLKFALEILQQKKIHCQIDRDDIFHMAWPNDMFDLVFNEGIPQHWTEDEKRQKCINEMMRVTKPGGTVIIIGNNGLNPEEQKIDQSFQFKYEGMPPTRKCFTPEELKSRMAVAGLLDVKVAILGPHLNTATLIGGYGRKS